MTRPAETETATPVTTPVVGYVDAPTRGYVEAPAAGYVTAAGYTTTAGYTPTAYTATATTAAGYTGRAYRKPSRSGYRAIPKPRRLVMFMRPAPKKTARYWWAGVNQYWTAHPEDTGDEYTAQLGRNDGVDFDDCDRVLTEYMHSVDLPFKPPSCYGYPAERVADALHPDDGEDLPWRPEVENGGLVRLAGDAWTELLPLLVEARARAAADIETAIDMAPADVVFDMLEILPVAGTMHGGGHEMREWCKRIVRDNPQARQAYLDSLVFQHTYLLDDDLSTLIEHAQHAVAFPHLPRQVMLFEKLNPGTVVAGGMVELSGAYLVDRIDYISNLGDFHLDPLSTVMGWRVLWMRPDDLPGSAC